MLIQAARTATLPDGLRELWQFRELLRNLTVKDLKARYRTAALGFAWFALHPMLQTLVLVTVFSLIVRLEVARYPAVVMCGVVPWGLFNTVVLGGLMSVVENGPLLKKVYFPREILPLSVVIGGLLNFSVSLLLLLVALLVLGVMPRPTWLLLPLVVAAQGVLVYGVSLWTSSLNVRYGDVKFLTEAALMVGFYLTPVFYPLSLVPGKLVPFFFLNPMAGLITIYRDLLLEGRLPEWWVVGLTLAIIGVILTTGYRLFKRLEPHFADVL